MPPSENKNNIISDPVHVSIDPVLKGNPALAQTAPAKAPTPVGMGGAYSVLNNQTYTPGQAPISIPASGQVINATAGPKSIIRTYKGDMESAIQTNHMASINIAIAENQKMQEQARAEQTSVPDASNYSASKIIIFISLILVIAGVAGIAYIYLTKEPVEEVARVTELPALITAEYKDELNLDQITKGKFISILSSKLNESRIPANSFYNLHLTVGTGTARQLISADEFVTQAGFDMPDMIQRTLLPDFMIGTYSQEVNLPFIILKTSYFENSYAGMLSWERNIENDFQTLFKLPGYENSGNVLDKLTPTTVKKLEDGVILNKDVRILRDENKKIILLYSIIDKETIVITVSDVAFKEILNRLNKEKTLKR